MASSSPRDGAIPGRLLPFDPAGAEGDAADTGGADDALATGRAIRHHRRAAGLTLAALGERVGMSAAALSLIENGRREPRVSTLTRLARVLSVDVGALLAPVPPSRRASLEVRLERAQRAAAFERLGLDPVRVGPGLPDDALEALVGMHEALAAVQAERAATPEFARAANAELRRRMREADNYFPQLEAAAHELLRPVGHTGGPVTHAQVGRIAEHLGFTLTASDSLPRSTRSITDREHGRIYLPRRRAGGHDPRALALQALAHLVLAHEPPRDYAEFLAQRVEVNYVAAAALVPEASAVTLLRQARDAKDLAIEDLRDGYGVSYETAAHRFTNLATRHLGLPVHFMRTAEDGVVYKAYENDGVRFPADPTGAIEGQRVCRSWTARTVFARPESAEAYAQYTDTGRGTYWCTAMVEQTPAGRFSVSVGVPFAQVRWMRGRDTEHRAISRCPDPDCCARAPEEQRRRWDGQVWPSALAQSHLLAVMPPGVFPGVDETEVLDFVTARGGTPPGHA